MPPLNAITATLPTDIMLDTGVVYLDGVTTPWGVMRNVTPNLPQEWKNAADDVDGAIYPIVGLDRRTGGVATIEGELVEFDAAKLGILEPGSSSAVVGGTTTITPKGAGDFLAGTTSSSGPYHAARVAFRRGDGTYAIVKFAHALITQSGWTGQKNGVASAKLKIEARQDAAAANTGVAPYVIILAATPDAG